MLIKHRAGGLALSLGLILSACSSSDNTDAGGAEGPWPPTDGRGSCAVEKQADVATPMRDGTILRADVYRPNSSDPAPVILMRTQYGKTEAQVQPARYQTPDWFASHCYLVVVQDIRGQGKSEGTFSEFTHDQQDGYDSVEWAAALPGSNGKVGMYGSSYVGATQWLAAIQTPPHLTTIVPANTSSDYYDGWTYEGGAFRLGFIEPWAMQTIATGAAVNRGDMATADSMHAAASDFTKWLNYRPYKDFPPLQPDSPTVAPWFFDWIRHSSRDDYWKQWSIRDHYANVTVPVLNFEGWYDSFLAGGVENFTGMMAHGGTAEARQNQRIVIGPWDHLSWGRPTSAPAPLLKDIGPQANSPINELMLDWFDHYLKGIDNKVSDTPQVDYFLMGANEWKSATNWPLPQTKWTDYYLSGKGGIGLVRAGALTTSPPPPDQKPDVYTYDPTDPVPSIGGHSCCGAQTGPQGPYDQAPAEQRSDVLVFTTEPLKEDTEITGPTTVKLWAASSAPDTDFTAKLTAVAPDGQVVNLNNGIIRAAFRDSLSDPMPITPGQPYQYTINIWPTSYLFKAGYRIRVEISSSDYPQYAPNPNTGEPFGQSGLTQPALQTIYHDAEHPSSITLPIIPAGN